MWAFAAAALIGVYQYYGFEACGDVAEEVRDPGRLIPKAMRRTIYIGGAAATFVCLALVLAVADIPAVIDGEDVDPVSTVLTEAFGPFGSKVILVIVLISFLVGAIVAQQGIVQQQGVEIVVHGPNLGGLSHGITSWVR